MSPHLIGKGTESYEQFLKEREVLMSKSQKKIVNPHRLKVLAFSFLPSFPPSLPPLTYSFQKSTQHTHSEPLDMADLEERRTSILTSIRSSHNHSTLRSSIEDIPTIQHLQSLNILLIPNSTSKKLFQGSLQNQVKLLPQMK